MNKFSRFMKKQGYYILLVLCVLLVATVITLSVVMSQRQDVPTANVPVDPDPNEPSGGGDPVEPDPMKFLAPVDAEIAKADDEFYGGALHRGIDYKVAAGTKVKASYTGVVVSCGFDKKLGNALVIKYDNGYTATYCGIDLNAKLDNGVVLSAGTQVTQGMHIATVAEANGFVCNSDMEEPHLHFQLRDTDNQDVNASYVDPTTVFGTSNK